MADTPQPPHPDDVLVPPRPDAAPPPPAAPEIPIYEGPVSMWIGFKTFFVSAVLDVVGLVLALYGAVNSGSGMSTPLVVCGIALLLASSLMITWVILVIRAQRYKITRKLIEREQGLIVKRIDALDLGRVKDVELKQSLVDRMLNIGTIEVFSSDKTDPVMFIEAIPNPRPVYEQLRDAVIALSQKRGIIPMT